MPGVPRRCAKKILEDIMRKEPKDYTVVKGEIKRDDLSHKIRELSKKTKFNKTLDIEIDFTFDETTGEVKRIKK
jgi:hypothetical protein